MSSGPLTPLEDSLRARFLCRLLRARLLMPGICLTPGKVKAYTDGRSLPEEVVPKAGGLSSTPPQASMAVPVRLRERPSGRILSCG